MKSGELLPSVLIEGLGPTTPAMARFLVECGGSTLVQSQKKPRESDKQFLDRMDTIYAKYDRK